ncbi:hypothetical protein TRFO_16372 [Tritrichomonas foetus]|uniref:Uncharacterized protein n=1 Tax=Tritrichomonas foetus TaxID=1144522 RepID=A0A1J4KQP2_9EUKA|nr:hypothetical protein TRFO_16372 [Tritrichomonas foetus]|eukprot:OHT13410.1 hypothetical protein TRFO_16372 [Tritrichomonas foetus]
MRSGYAFVPNKETKPTTEEFALIQAVIRDEYTNAISEWLINQKPKLRAKFIKFMETVLEADVPDTFSEHSTDVAERFARDIFQHMFHPVLRSVIDESCGEFSDVIHLLSIHMSRSNVMASITQKRDETPKLLKAIAQEDHILSRPHQPRHELPKPSVGQAMTRARMADPLPQVPPTRSYKPTGTRSSPFASFPTSEPMETTYRSEYQNYEGQYKRTEQSGVCNVVNAPTCL